VLKYVLRGAHGRWRKAGLGLPLAIAAHAATAQEPTPTHPALPDPPSQAIAPFVAEPASSPPRAPSATPAAPSERQVRFRTAATLMASIGVTAAYGRSKWWQEGLSGGFNTVNEGWFGRGTDHGGADKLGHAMFAYTGTRLLARAFEWAGNDADAALKLGLWTAVGISTGVEVIDGHSKKWGFSREDALLNLAGGALGYWLEKSTAADALLDVRLQYSPSNGPAGRRGFNPFGDYSGQRYLAVFKLSGVPALRERPLLRYLEFSIGYGTRNFDKDSRALLAPTRHAYYGVSLNLSDVLRSTAFKGNTSPSHTQRLTETFLEFVQIPAATVQGDHVIR
jgi:hypothetical protein